MLAIQRPVKTDTCAINIIPCRVHHTGPIKVTKRHWKPVMEEDSNKVSYFRGRKLKEPPSRSITDIKATERVLVPAPSAPQAPLDSDDDEEQPEPVKILEHVSDIKEITVWGHDQLPPTDDAYHKGIDEWFSFAQAVHGS